MVAGRIPLAGVVEVEDVEEVVFLYPVKASLDTHFAPVHEVGAAVPVGQAFDVGCVRSWQSRDVDPAFATVSSGATVPITRLASWTLQRAHHLTPTVAIILLTQGSRSKVTRNDICTTLGQSVSIPLRKKEIRIPEHPSNLEWALPDS